MSLRTLFLLMGLVTSAMIAGLIYTKILRAPDDAQVSMAEQRAIDRVCDVQCSDRATELSKQARSPDELQSLARQCVAQCRVQMHDKYLQSTR